MFCLQGAPLPKIPVVIGEIGAYDYGNNELENKDTTNYQDTDKEWIARTAQYLKAQAASTNAKVSYFLWCWNSNSRKFWASAAAAGTYPCHALTRMVCRAALLSTPSADLRCLG